MSTVLPVPIERREFLYLIGTAGTGAALAGCASSPPESTSPRPDRSESVAAVPSQTASPAAGVTTKLGPQVVHGPRNHAKVALTFHGQGPVPMADALLSETERAGARVTVLAVGTWLEQFPQMAHRVLRVEGERHLGVVARPVHDLRAELYGHAGCRASRL